MKESRKHLCLTRKDACMRKLTYAAGEEEDAEEELSITARSHVCSLSWRGRPFFWLEADELVNSLFFFILLHYEEETFTGSLTHALCALSGKSHSAKSFLCTIQNRPTRFTPPHFPSFHLSFLPSFCLSYLPYLPSFISLMIRSTWDQIGLYVALE